MLTSGSDVMAVSGAVAVVVVGSGSWPSQKVMNSANLGLTYSSAPSTVVFAFSMMQLRHALRSDWKTLPGSHRASDFPTFDASKKASLHESKQTAGVSVARFKSWRRSFSLYGSVAAVLDGMG